ncbi:MAG: hypothetical protein ND866_12220 [Pyrinomonadaceae bacterium]|nr:hypothetical protein [Pyrinomonadaceae bacterium]
MKMRKRTTKVTVETERTFIFRSRDYKQSGWCAVCGAEAEMLTLEAAARTASVGELAIWRRIEARSLHFSEAADGRVFICLNSLRR